MSRLAESLLLSRRPETLVHLFTNTMTYEKGAKPHSFLAPTFKRSPNSHDNIPSILSKNLCVLRGLRVNTLPQLRPRVLVH